MIGFSFLKARQTSNLDMIRSIEREIDFDLPLMYRRFLHEFELGVKGFKWHKYKASNESDPLWIGLLIFDVGVQNKTIVCQEFFDCQTFLEKFDNNIYTEEYENLNLIQIGDIGIGGGLYLGIGDENYDKIYAVAWDWEESPILLANDIFELASSITFQENEDYLKIAGLQSYDQICIRWGDEFWSDLELSVET